MARKAITPEVEIVENIHSETLEEIMGTRFATYAKYVIQDRAIPDARDGLKPVQRRIIFAMYKDGNIFTRPTRKCAHTVGAPFKAFAAQRDHWARETAYVYPGPIQYWGPTEVCDQPTRTLALEQSK